jgi:hypothetical protein
MGAEWTLEAGLCLFYGREAGKELVYARGGEESPDAVGDANEDDLATAVGLRDVEVDDDAETGRVHVLEPGAVDDEEVSVNRLQLGLQGEDMAQGERSPEGQNGAAGIRRGAKRVVELILGHPLRIEIPMGA